MTEFVDGRTLYFFADYESLAELYTEEMTVMQREIEDFGLWILHPQNQVVEVSCTYNDWILWCLKRPSWAVKFRIGQ